MPKSQHPPVARTGRVAAANRAGRLRSRDGNGLPLDCPHPRHWAACFLGALRRETCPYSKAIRNNIPVTINATAV